MELQEQDPNRCEILFGERWPFLVRETSMLFEVLCRRSEEAKRHMRGHLEESGAIRTYDDWSLERRMRGVVIYLWFLVLLDQQ